jgi:hypothetical protein
LAQQHQHQGIMQDLPHLTRPLAAAGDAARTGAEDAAESRRRD